MNRQTKRTLQRQGQLGPDGAPVASAPARQQPAQRRSQPVTERESFPHRTAEYLREVRGELVKVAWPGRPEVINYTIVVLVTLVLLTAFVFGLNYLFGHFVFWLFPKRK